MLMRVEPGIDLLIQKLFLGMRADVVQPWHPVDYVDGQREPIDFVVDGEFHWRIDVASLLVAAHVQVSVIVSTVSEAMNQPWVTMEVENNRLVGSEQAVEIAIAQAMRVLMIALHLE